MMRQFTPALLTIILALCFTGCAASQRDAPAARHYLRALHAALGGIEGDLPAITASADAAAERYLDPRSALGIHGDVGFFREAVDRSGGVMRVNSANHAANAAGVVLYCVNDATLEKDLAGLKYPVNQGAMIIAFGRDDQLDTLRARETGITTFISSHAPRGVGLFVNDAGERIIPVHRAANIAAMWVWTGEFVAALTRRGKMPPMYQGFAVPGGRERLDRIGRGTKFHEHAPTAVKAGVVGREFLAQLRVDLRKVESHEMPNIRAAAERTERAHADGGALYAFLHGHVIGATLDQPGDPAYFDVLNTDYIAVRDDVALKGGDVIFCVGYDQPFDGEWFKHFATRARDSGATLIWSFTDYKPDLIAALPAEEIVINQRWAFGDAVVALPGYDVKILPTSGVIAEAVVWMVHAEMFRLREPAAFARAASAEKTGR